MDTSDLVTCPGVLALELTPEGHPQRQLLERDEADVLASFIAADLRALIPELAQARLVVGGAHFDSTEILRPGFPIFATLSELASHAQGEVIAFGARKGHMPAEVLVPDPRFVGGPLRAIPFAVLAPPELAGKIGTDMENELVGRGEIGAGTADYLMRTLAMRLEHGRYFSHHDLMALVDVHYQHMNLLGLWELVEAALLGPNGTEHDTSARGLGWRFDAGTAVAWTPGKWLATQPPVEDLARRAHDVAGIVFELRQYVALLGAHHIPVAFDGGEYLDAEHSVIDTLAAPLADAPVALYAHEAPGLGVIAVTAAQALPAGGSRVLANAWPLSPRVKPTCAWLAGKYGCADEPSYLGRVVLDVAGALSVGSKHPAAVAD